MLKKKIPNFDPLYDLPPIRNPENLGLDDLRDWRGDNIDVTLAFEVFYEVDLIETAVTQHLQNPEILSESIDGLFEEFFCPMSAEGVPRTIPEIDNIP